MDRFDPSQISTGMSKFLQSFRISSAFVGLVLVGCGGGGGGAGSGVSVGIWQGSYSGSYLDLGGNIGTISFTVTADGEINSGVITPQGLASSSLSGIVNPNGDITLNTPTIQNYLGRLTYDFQPTGGTPVAVTLGTSAGSGQPPHGLYLALIQNGTTIPTGTGSLGTLAGTYVGFMDFTPSPAPPQPSNIPLAMVIGNNGQVEGITFVETANAAPQIERLSGTPGKGMGAVSFAINLGASAQGTLTLAGTALSCALTLSHGGTAALNLNQVSP